MPRSVSSVRATTPPTAAPAALRHEVPHPTGDARPDLTDEERQVLALLETHEYEEVRARTGWSKGRIYALALRCGARKTEARIRERTAERRRRQQAFLQEMLNTTAKADVLDFLAGLPDESVACHLTSPPYNVGKRYLDAPGADVLPFTYYHGWLMMVVAELARTLQPGGVLFLQVGATRDWTGHLMPLDVLLFEDCRRAGLTFQNRIVWTVPHGLTPKRRLAARYETALVFSKGEPRTFNPTPARTPQKQPGKVAYKGPRRGELSGHPFGAWPSDVWPIPSVRANHPDRAHGDHPAQFPVALAKRAILLYTAPGDLVVDVFRGSGTVPVAAIETGRAFSGCDLWYEDLAARRTAAATPDLISVLPGISDESAALRQRALAAAADGDPSETTALAVWQAEATPVRYAAPAIDAAADAQLRLTFVPRAR